MGTRLCYIALGLFSAGLSGCGGLDDASCDTNDDCVAGRLCRDGDCVQCDPVRIQNESLPSGVLEVPYEFPLEAAYGVAPYSWSLSGGPEWLTIDAEHGILAGTPDQAATGLPVQVRVDDQTTGRDSFAEATLTIDIDVCVDGSVIACYQPDQGKCLDGNQTCSGGRWGTCITSGTSIDVEHCGPDCGPCDERVANRCVRGACACGDSSPCTGNEICCDNACVDASSDAANCGACGVDCAEDLRNTVNPHCHEGACAHDGCIPGFMDCNGDPHDGCETDVTLVERCGGCERDCTELTRHVVEIVCSDDGGTYDCGYNRPPGCQFGFLDCDARTSNGCETPVSDQDCGVCGLACVDSVCRLHPGGDHYYCGCNQDADCGNGRQCCDDYCFGLYDPAHCGNCNNDCTRVVRNAETILCDQGTCGYTTCLPLFLDCDGNRENGCEQAMDDDNCGECGFSCGAYARCEQGACACDADMGNCNTDWTDGCESNLLTDEENCGDCGIDCNVQVQNVSTLYCDGGLCNYSECVSEDYDDCDADRTNGCETNLQTDNRNCGECGVSCYGYPCMVGNCTPMCSTPYADCDGDLSTNCETNTLSDIRHCGGCGNDCGMKNYCCLGTCSPDPCQ